MGSTKYRSGKIPPVNCQLEPAKSESFSANNHEEAYKGGTEASFYLFTLSARNCSLYADKPRRAAYNPLVMYSIAALISSSLQSVQVPRAGI